LRKEIVSKEEQKRRMQMMSKNGIIQLRKRKIVSKEKQKQRIKMMSKTENYN
jgi:ribosomal protein L35